MIPAKGISRNQNKLIGRPLSRSLLAEAANQGVKVAIANTVPKVSSITFAIALPRNSANTKYQ